MSIPRKPHHKGFRRPDYPALLAKQIAKRKPGEMDQEYAKPHQVPILCEAEGCLFYVNPSRVGRVKRCPIHISEQGFRIEGWQGA